MIRISGLLTEMQSLLVKGKQYLFEKLKLKQSASSTHGLCCISISATELHIVYANHRNDKLVVTLCETHAYTSETDLSTILKPIVAQNQLNQTACSLILRADAYQLLVTDTLPVTEAEFQAAIRWKIKDLLHFPANDIVIDHFDLPKMKAAQNKMMVVAAQMSKLKTAQEQFNQSDLNLKYINVPELCLRNIAVLYEKDDNATALIYVQQQTIHLIITCQQQLYVSRVLKFSLNHQDPIALMQGMERLAAEILRSFDYYQSLWEKPTPTQFIFASVKTVTPESLETLSQRIRTPVSLMQINDVIDCQPNLSVEQQGEYLLAIGGALIENHEYQQDINLYQFLPQKSGFELTRQLVFASYGLFAGLLFLSYLTSLWQVHRLNNRVDHLTLQMQDSQQELTTLTQEFPASNIPDLRKSIDQISVEYDNKSKVLDLLSPYANFSANLIGLGNAIVSGVWLTQINFDRGETKIMLRGYALSPTMLQQFYDQLGKQPIFSSLTFKVNELKQTSFPLSFYITAKKVNKT